MKKDPLLLPCYTSNKHAAEARTAIREEVTFVKQQLEKPVFPVIHQNKHAAEARTAICDEVTFVKRQLEKSISPVVQGQASRD